MNLDSTENSTSEPNIVSIWCRTGVMPVYQDWLIGYRKFASLEIGTTCNRKNLV